MNGDKPGGSFMKRTAFLALACCSFFLFGCGDFPQASALSSFLKGSSTTDASTSGAVESSLPSSTSSIPESSNPVSSSASETSSSLPYVAPSMEDLLTKVGEKLTLKGFVHGIQDDGFSLSFPTGYAYVKNPKTVSGLRQRIRNLDGSAPNEGDYVQVTGTISTDNGYLEIDVAATMDIVVVKEENLPYTIPLPRTMTAIELSNYMKTTYIEWIQGGGNDDMPSQGPRTPIPLIKEEILCPEFRVFPKDERGYCDAFGPGLDVLDFDARFLDSGYGLENGAYQLTFYMLSFDTTTCAIALTGAKKLTPEFPYTTIADLKKNPVRGAHYNIQGKIMGDAYGNYVVDDGTGRILVFDSHLDGTYGTAYQEVGSILSFNGCLNEIFFEARYELFVYSLSTTITHAPTASFVPALTSFPESEYTVATASTSSQTPYWVSERFTCTLSYKSGGLASDPTLRCAYKGDACVIINYKALGDTNYPATFTFVGYLVYGYDGMASLLFDGHILD